MKAIQYAVLACAAVFSAACSKDQDDESFAPIETTAVKVMHAAPFSKFPIRALLGGAELDVLAYGQRSRSYLLKPVADGLLALQNAATQAYVFRVAQPVHKDTAYSVFVYNPTAFTVAAVVTTDFPRPAAGANRALIRLANFGFDAGAVTLTAQEAGASPLVPAVGYGAVGPFVAVDARAYALDVRNASGVVLASSNLPAAADGVYTVLVRGRNSSAAPADEQLTVEVIKNEE